MPPQRPSPAYSNDHDGTVSSGASTQVRPPLDDVRVLAVEQYGAGPFGSSHLVELGAEVIKIEDPDRGGDVGRYVPPFQHGTDSLFFQTFNRGKRGIALDLRSEAGREVFEALVAQSDAVYSNLRGDVPAKLGLRYDDLRHLNPRIVCCSLSAYGTDGPRHAEPGYDYIVQGLAGWMSLTGEPNGPPTKTGLSLVDFAAGYVAAASLVTGIHAARRDGQGMDCDISLFDVAFNLLTYVATWHLTAGFEPGRTRHSAHPSLVPFQNFATSDGWIVLGCAKEKFWSRLVETIDRPDLAADPRFTDFSSRAQHADALIAELEPVFAQRSTDQWVDVLTVAGVPCGPVNDVAAALQDPQVAARELILETEHPVFGTVRQVRSPFRLSTVQPTSGHGPALGEDTGAVLSELLGLDSADLARLDERGAFGTGG